MQLESMEAFFQKRVDGYDQHMMENIEGAGQFYIEVAKRLPRGKSLKILDLGCGTGLELEQVFQLYPAAQITGIDLSGDMLMVLKQKFLDKAAQLRLVQQNYFEYPYETGQYDAAISVESLHHFTHKAKLDLYQKVYEALKPGGKYIEADYMVDTQEEEDYHFAEYERIRCEQGITDGFYHYDTPCTVDNQIKLLTQAGFKKVEQVWRLANTVVLVGSK